MQKNCTISVLLINHMNIDIAVLLIPQYQYNSHNQLLINGFIVIRIVSYNVVHISNVIGYFPILVPLILESITSTKSNTTVC
jgi:hypothetical protein